MKKVIGIYANYNGGEISQTAPYIKFISNFGEPKLILTSDNPDEIVKQCDALLVPGGADVNPSRYGEVPHPLTGRANVQYEYLDSVIIPAFVAAKKPIIGICRGMQTLNVHFGGTLFQHIINHNQMETVTSRKETKQELYVPRHGNFVEKFKINSIHHQAVKDLAPDLEPIGYTTVYEECPSLFERSKLYAIKPAKKAPSYLCIVEAYKHKTLPVLGFQYHPEEFNCKFAIAEIKKILK